MLKKALVMNGAPREWETITICQALGMGLQKNNYEILDARSVNRLPYKITEHYDVGVVFGYRQPVAMLCQELNRNGIPCLIGELGYLKRMASTRQDGVWKKLPTDNDYFQVGINTLCWLPPPFACAGDRFAELGFDRETERQEGDHVLILGQTIGDAQHNYGLRAMLKWQTRVIATLKMHTKRPIVWRPHPKQEGTLTGGPLADPKGCDRVSLPSRTSLEEDLKNCHAVVTINSTAGNFALLSGVPVFCEPFAMYAEVANTDLSRIEDPVFPDTGDYFNRLAYSQWTKNEMIAGAAVPFWEIYLDEYRSSFKLAVGAGN